MEGGTLKTARNLLLALIGVLFALMPVQAAVIQMDSGAYSTPDGYGTIASQSTINLAHYKYYEWYVSDFVDEDRNADQIDIVFHDIYNYAYEENILNLYIMDYAGTDTGIFEDYDHEDPEDPDWIGNGWISLGNWSYPDSNPDPDADPADETYDVVFTITDREIIDLLTNGDGFILGLDPECHFYGSGIEINAPVPEPATMLLVGFGLLGASGYTRTRKKR